ncbi:MAG: succinate dehydrogenase, hydrophobic membrane anchor protein [Paracoccaceae bacterium]|tara:strand:+ start:1318 stop:1659 length:342 start_codon:yes stop_codon:yes gene_type:complete
MTFKMVKTGTSHFRAMKISSMILVLLIPLFLFTIAPIVGEKREIILAKLEQPIYALIVALTFTVGLLHFKSGVQVLIEDYVHGSMSKVWINITIALSYLLIGLTLFALTKILL